MSSQQYYKVTTAGLCQDAFNLRAHMLCFLVLCHYLNPVEHLPALGD